ncbi:hypothetical protein [Candidatus Burkholderia verschuerenii]|uniref:hypothetical protein n=1 Tax=Candidatus Burkholderia verschuerenii TaxID=242163 RepID=UPI00067D2F80|nr:hypothetical protein [Candidatus Burkholderia verschuerenii]
MDRRSSRRASNRLVSQPMPAQQPHREMPAPRMQEAPRPQPQQIRQAPPPQQPQQAQQPHGNGGGGNEHHRG